MAPGGPDPPPPAAGGGEPASARVAEARSRARERVDRQRQALRPLGWGFIAIVVTASAQTHPAPGVQGSWPGGNAGPGGLRGSGRHRGNRALGAARPGRAGRRDRADRRLPGWCWPSCSRTGRLSWRRRWQSGSPRSGCRPAPAAATAGAITAALALAVGLTEHPAAQSAITATLVCLLLAVTGQFIRRGRESQDRTELLLAQLQDARDAEAAAAALAERSRIAGELHDVLAHSLSGLAIQLQGARKLAEREPVSAGLRAAIERSAELTQGRTR